MQLIKRTQLALWHAPVYRGAGANYSTRSLTTMEATDWGGDRKPKSCKLFRFLFRDEDTSIS
jgi:hypothetical protein